MKSMGLRKILAILTAALVCMAGLAGCSQDTSADNTGKAAADASSESSAPEESAQPDEGETTEMAVKLVYGNGKSVSEGFSQMPLLYVTDGTLESADGDLVDDIRGTLELLAVLPEDQDLEEPVTFVTDDYIKINGITVTDGCCTLDLDGETALSQDMYTEMFFVYQTCCTIMESFGDQVTSVTYTVDCQKEDYLSYIDLSQPFTLDDFQDLLSTSQE